MKRFVTMMAGVVGLLAVAVAPALAGPADPLVPPAFDEVTDLATIVSRSVSIEGVDGASREYTEGATGEDTLTVYDSAYLGDRLYLAGDFTSAGGQTHIDVTAIDMRTRRVDHGFSARTNGVVHVVVAAPDRSGIYIGGTFTRVNGQDIQGLAKLHPETGALLALPSEMWVGGRVLAIEVDGDRVYVGGEFSAAGGATRQAVAAWEGGVLDRDFAPAVTFDGLPAFVDSIDLAPDRRSVFVAGRVGRVDGVDIPYRVAKLDAANGRLVPGFVVTDSPDQVLIAQYGGKSGATNTHVRDVEISADGTIGMLAMSNSSDVGNRVHAFDTTTGRGLWTIVMSGDPQTLEVVGRTVVLGGHFHAPLGWGGVNPPYDFNGRQVVAHRLTALDLRTGGPVQSFTPVFNSWWGVWDLESTPWGLAVVGAFTTVDGRPAPHVLVLNERGSVATPTAVGGGASVEGSPIARRGSVQGP